MIRTYYLTYEGDEDEILEQHGHVMKQLREMRKKKLDLTVSFDSQRRIGRELFHLAKRGIRTGVSLVGEGARKGAKELSEAID